MKAKKILVTALLGSMLLSACAAGISTYKLIEPPQDFNYSGIPGSIAYITLECGDALCTNLGIIEPDFDSALQLTSQMTGLVTDISWSPDGRYIAYSLLTIAQTAYTQMWLYDLPAGQSRLLTEDFIDTPYSLSWSPDNRYLLIAGKDEVQGTWSLTALNVETKERFEMLADSTIYSDISASWSPAGDWIVFAASKDNGKSQLWSAATDGSSMTALTTDGTIASLQPSWAPDGNSLAYYRMDDQGKVELWTMGPKGQSLAMLVELGSDASLERPVWSPDGRYLSVIHGNEDGTEVLLIELSTAKKIRLNQKDGKYSMLSWAPDSSALIYMENRGTLDHWINMFVFNGGQPFVASAPVDFNAPVWSPAEYTP